MPTSSEVGASEKASSEVIGGRILKAGINLPEAGASEKASGELIGGRILKAGINLLLQGRHQAGKALLLVHAQLADRVHFLDTLLAEG
eukprot:CAMPEP_0177268538 /NCGR_PEP_ID=MMETSP0367-20130122/63866_1 /TAXON_ID=447022 ORGANISM="Scrippsiella hangoei-like, Strain SHHI-4" /NCGR_SAMPLE_ID=MMETSP0367 /ASSEMBLY_ACC=CAM_ASM_000362 /LENGTH=87 /DNA_ID=CAMNT_0018724171 /DNA_START=139 /DNA_END=399 /DNA_ORIENTATION=-